MGGTQGNFFNLPGSAGGYWKSPAPDHMNCVHGGRDAPPGLHADGDDRTTVRAEQARPPPPPHGALPAQSMHPPDPPDLPNLEAIGNGSAAVGGDEQLQAQVEQLQVQVDELKAEVNQLKAEVGQVENLKAQIEQLQVQVAQNAPVRAPVQARVVGVVPHVDVVGEC